MSTTTFAALGVPDFVCDALERRGITSPFEIQAATIADALAGRDVLGRAPTGSGKTLAFGIPLVANADALGRCRPGRPAALVLAPTRELAEQITGEIRSFSGRLRVDAVYGGVGYGAQLTALRRGVDILVACPGRLEDLISRGDVDLGDVVQVVLDEADQMADMGFLPAVRRLLDRTSPDRQTVLFSATLDGEVAKLTRDYQRDPVRHEVGEATPDIRAAAHRFWTTERMERNPVVAEVVKAAWPSIIFCRTRHGADRLARQLSKLGVETAPIHGGRSQSQRNRALEDFTAGRVHALVATDVAARGIHVDGVASVIHYDPPEDHKTYVHRSGRTARAGAEGVVVSLVQPDQVKELRKVQRLVGLDEPFTEPSVDLLPTGHLDGGRELAAGRRDAAPAKRQGKAKRDRTRRQHGPGHARRDDAAGDRRDHDRRFEGDRARRRGAGDVERSNEESRADRGRSDRGSKPAPGTPNGRGSAPSRAKGANRKARRAHLQPGHRPD